MIKKRLSFLLTLLLIALLFASCAKEADAPARYQYDLSEYIDLAEYKGLPAETNSLTITDDMIREQIDATRVYYARVTPVTDRGAEPGDVLTIKYVSSIDGMPVAELTSDETEITVGTGFFPLEVENALLGTKAGDIVSVDTTLENATDESLIGQVIHLDISVTSVGYKELPEYTDDFVRAYLGYDSTAELEEQVRKNLEKHYRELYEQAVDSQVWSTVVENTVVKAYPEKEVKALYDDLINADQAVAMTQGVEFATYLMDRYGMTEDEFYANAQTRAEKQIKEEMVCYAIARAENITISDDEYTKRARQYAVDSGYDSLEDLEADYDKATISEYILFDMVHEAVIGYADVAFTDSAETNA